MATKSQYVKHLLAVFALLVLVSRKTPPNHAHGLTFEVNADDLGQGSCTLNKLQLLCAVLVPTTLAIALAWTLQILWSRRKERKELKVYRAGGNGTA